MNRRILKFALNAGANRVSMPGKAQLLHIAVEADQLCLWALVNPDEPVETRAFQVEPTGATVEAGRHVYIGTFLLEANSWCAALAPPHLDVGSWHVFEEVSKGE